MHHASKIYALSLLNLFLNLNLSAQSIAWTDISSSYSLPSGIKVFRGERASPALRAFYLDADLNNPKLAIRAYLSSLAEKKETVAPFCQRVGAYAAINGGFFNTSTGDSYSSVVYPDAVKAFNIAGVNRTVGGTSLYFPVTRSFFGMDAKYKFSVEFTILERISLMCTDTHSLFQIPPQLQLQPRQ
jgi:hypothetical protein